MTREPGDGEGQGSGKRKRARAPRPSPSQLSPEERLAAAGEAALRLLSNRERSRVELRSRLARKGYDPETIVRVLDQLGEAGLQSDERFAELFAEEAKRSKGLSSFALQGELRRRGVAQDLAAEVATEPPEEEEERARALLQRRAARLSALPPEVRNRRLSSYLARRGYPVELCARLVAEAAESRIP